MKKNLTQKKSKSSAKLRTKLLLSLLTVVALQIYGVRNVKAELLLEDDLENSSTSLEQTATATPTEPSSASADKKVMVREADLPRTEVLRRHRLRQELHNEDRLTERLEELRLRDEMKRVDALVGPASQANVSAATQSSTASSDSRANAAMAVPVASSQPSEKISATQKSSAVMETQINPDEEVKSEKKSLGVSITPRGGLMSFSDEKFEVTSKYSFGATLGFDFLSFMTGELGYSYSTFQLNSGSAFNQMPYYGAGYGSQSLNMNQHLIEMGVRANLLGNENRVRPFLSGGFGYFRNSINLDDNTLAYVRQYNSALATDYTISGLAGSLGAGLEVKITDHISVLGMFKYYQILTSRQSNPISGAAFVNPNTYGNQNAANLGTSSDPRLQASQKFSQNSFYSIQGGIGISF